MSMLNIARMFEEGYKKRGHEVRVVRPKKVFCIMADSSTRGLAKWLGYIDKLLIFPSELKKEAKWADVVHICDHSNSMYTKYLNNVPNIITCCDFLAVRSALGEFKQNYTKWSGRLLQKIIWTGINWTHRVVCISEKTKSDLFKLGKLDDPSMISRLSDSEVKVLYLGLNYPYAPMEKKEYIPLIRDLGVDPETPYFLHVGKNNWYKNKKGLVDIFKFLKERKDFKAFKLVVAGSPLSVELKERLEKYGLEGQVKEVVSPDTKYISALYSGAKALIYPSIAEGFGWPIIESQACGCPVFTSNRAPMTEAGGEAAVYFDPGNPEGAARVIIDTLQDEHKIKEMRLKGFKNVQRFDKDKMVDVYIQVLQEARKHFDSIRSEIKLAHPSLRGLMYIPRYSKYNIGFVSLGKPPSVLGKILEPIPFVRKVILQVYFSFRLVFNVWKISAKKDLIIISEIFPAYMLLANILLFPLRKKIIVGMNQIQQYASISILHRSMLEYFRWFRFNSLFFDLDDSILEERLRISKENKLTIPHPINSDEAFLENRKWTSKDYKYIVGIFGKERVGKIPLDDFAKYVNKVIGQVFPGLILKIGLPKTEQDLYEKLVNDGYTVVNTESREQLLDFLRSVDITIHEFDEKYYYFRPSATIMEAINCRCHAICPDYPVLKHQVMWPERVGTCFSDLSGLPEAIREAINYMQSSDMSFYEKHQKERAAKSIVRYIDDFIDRKRS